MLSCVVFLCVCVCVCWFCFEYRIVFRLLFVTIKFHTAFLIYSFHRVWQFLSQVLRKKDLILITNPSIEESLQGLQVKMYFSCSRSEGI